MWDFISAEFSQNVRAVPHEPERLRAKMRRNPFSHASLESNRGTSNLDLRGNARKQHLQGHLTVSGGQREREAMGGCHGKEWVKVRFGLLYIYHSRKMCCA